VLVALNRNNKYGKAFKKLGYYIAPQSEAEMVATYYLVKNF
jgi:hypothetical protein